MALRALLRLTRGRLVDLCQVATIPAARGYPVQRRLLHLTLTLVVVASLFSSASPVRTQGAFVHGTVVALQGTPHLWFADEQGVLHWGGDTRALAGKHIAWNNRVEVSLDSLRTLPVGDPWLSAGLLKDGDPIYLVKWETDWPLPQLLHIQSIKDVELFGINGNNYGKFVIEKSEWEHRFGISAAGLQRGVLATTAPSAPPAVPGAVPTATPSFSSVVTETSGTWTSFDRKKLQIEVLSYDPDGWREMVIENGFNDPPLEGHRYLIVTVRIRNPETYSTFLSGIELQGGGRKFTTFGEYSRCVVIPNDLRDAIYDKFDETKIPGGQEVTGNVCFQVPENLRHLSLVPDDLWSGDAIRVVGSESLPATDRSGIERRCGCARTRADGGCDRRYSAPVRCHWVVTG